MSKPKLSLIIAMYNIRDYIGECLESCLKQEGVNDDDYEIIVVNDGSTDDSAEVASQAIEGHNNAVILQKENGGLSDARNYGFKHSLGEYVWFIDGDDLIDKLAVRQIIEATVSDAQVYILDYSELLPDGEIKHYSFQESQLPQGIFNGYKLVSEDKIPFPPMMAWLQIQNRSFIDENELLFLKGAKSEDIEYTSKLFSVATKVQRINSYLYIYRKSREGSIFTGLKNDAIWIDNLLNIFSSVSEYLNKHNACSSYSNKVLTVISTFVIYNLYSQKRDKFRESQKLIKKRGLDFTSVLLKRRDTKNFIKWFSYSCLPYCLAKKILGRY